ncbi:hypothetical protein Syn7803US7_39 [Synechococcus phage ACG-2014f]|uniref:Uncharacterized protein n=1 Tax=Synechococcus phage ACG-2014f TaxID=1493511 RepID=A0A0E3FW90_9CAUD|nr:hypothetical protein Syn7803US7_39 [Synechococcus phage ACG-2014f]
MARHSEVLIQGTEVPGLRMIVTVPVDHTWASETAESIYGFGGNTQYIWRKSWETNQPAPRGGGSSSSSSGMGPGAILMGMIGLILVAGIGSAFEGNDTPSAPSYDAPAPVERTYVPQAPAASYDNGPCLTANFEPC